MKRQLVSDTSSTGHIADRACSASTLFWSSLTPLPGSILLPAPTVSKCPTPRAPIASLPPVVRVSLKPGNGTVGGCLADLPLISSPGSAGQNRLSAGQMASRWPAVGASMRRRSLQNQGQLEESEALQPAVGHPDTSSGALDSLCRQFQRRLPLRAVSLNLRAGPSWKPLETPQPGQQGLQAAARSAKNALGAVSQVISNMSRYGGPS